MFKGMMDIPVDKQLWFLALFLWALVWKGLAMWKAARVGARYWFWAFLLVNTLGILEILYIYMFSEGGLKFWKKKSE
jgi:uncharacterized protein DUF5652